MQDAIMAGSEEAAVGRARPWRGVIAAAVTPAQPDLSVDVPRLAAHLRWLFAQGCDMAAVFGTTGEGPSIATEAKIAALGALVEAGIEPGRLVPGVMASSLEDARRMMAAAERLGCRGALLLPPFYYADPTAAGLVAFVEQAAAAAPGLDVLLYHIPAMSRVPFRFEVIGELARRLGAQLAGIKDSSADRAHSLALARSFPQLAVFTGMDCDLPALLDAGGAGIIGGLPNVNARGLRAVFDTPPGAQRDTLAAQANALLDVVVRHGGPMPIKALVARLHGDAAWLRGFAPLEALSAEAADALNADFAAAGFDFEHP
jgi:4-hydroxy-tetrahydrodipicolinate synthase